MSNNYTNRDQFTISDTYSDSYESDSMDQPSTGYIYIARSCPCSDSGIYSIEHSRSRIPNTSCRNIYLISWCKFIEQKMSEHNFVRDSIVFFACENPQYIVDRLWDKLDELGYQNASSNRAYWYINTSTGYEQILQYMQRYARF